MFYADDDLREKLDEEMVRRGQIGSPRNPFPVTWLHQLADFESNQTLDLRSSEYVDLEKEGVYLQ
jgi:hypothetical protein